MCRPLSVLLSPLVPLGRASLFSAIFFCSSRSHTRQFYHMLMYSLYKPKPCGASREVVLLGKQRKSICINPSLILFGYQVVPDPHNISPQEKSVFHSRVEGTSTEVKWLAQGHSADTTVWQNFRDIRASLELFGETRSALFYSIPSEVSHRLPYVDSPLQQFLPPVWAPATWNRGFSSDFPNPPPIGLWFPVNYCLPSTTLMPAQCWLF